MAFAGETVGALRGFPSSPGHKVWDMTCHDTFAPSNIQVCSTVLALYITDCAASSKRLLYSDLCHSYAFIPIAVESSGSFGKDALDFLHELGKRTRCKNKDPLSYLKLCQKINVCIQKFNSVTVLGCSSNGLM